MVNCFEALAKRFLALEIRFFSKIGFLKPRVEEVSRLEIRFFSKIGFLKPRVEEVSRLEIRFFSKIGFLKPRVFRVLQEPPRIINYSPFIHHSPFTIRGFSFLEKN